jgi:hypothetical protein
MGIEREDRPMNIQDLALVVEGINNGLGGAMKSQEQKDLSDLAKMFRRFSDQTVGDFVKFVDRAFVNERDSVPALVERIKRYENQKDEPIEELKASLGRAKADDLKKILKAFALKPARNKPANLHLIESQLLSNDVATVTNNEDAEIQRAYQEYESIKADLEKLSVDEIRRRFAPLADLPKSVLAGVAGKVGYRTDESKTQLGTMLLDNLIGIKISLEQTKPLLIES